MIVATCHFCGQTIEKTGDEWTDDIGIGCTGQGEWGEVVMHVPERDTKGYLTDSTMVPIEVKGVHGAVPSWLAEAFEQVYGPTGSDT